jgi:ribosomal-protein-alanine N-acetyltransferase
MRQAGGVTQRSAAGRLIFGGQVAIPTLRPKAATRGAVVVRIDRHDLFYDVSDGKAVILETERLDLREVHEEDAEFVLELLNSAGFVQNIGDRGVRTVEQAAEYIRERFVKSYREHGFGMWAVLARGDAEPVGICGLIRRETLPHVDIGYAFLERAFGKGYAQESAAAVLAYGRDALRLETIVAITGPDNQASRRVLEKIGLQYVGLVEVEGWVESSAYYST